MKAQYTVKFNGKWYKAGEEIPERKTSGSSDFKQYTKSEINRMSTAELQSLAKEHGIVDADETTGGELKKILIEKFKL